LAGTLAREMAAGSVVVCLAAAAAWLAVAVALWRAALAVGAATA
jgi:hypothetical protein